jgi:hypothetical protein
MRGPRSQNNWAISECSGLSFGRNLSRGAKLLSSSLGIASRLQQNDKPKVIMAAVKQQVLNWLYSVLTSVSLGDTFLRKPLLSKI